MDIVSIATIQSEAVDAADAGTPFPEACRWPTDSEAAQLFKASYEKRARQLELMQEPA